MKAARIHNFGGPEVIVFEDVPRPMPATGEVLVRVAAAGVAPWDALIREGKSKVSPTAPLTLGSDLCGVVEAVGAGVIPFKSGDEIYGHDSRSGRQRRCLRGPACRERALPRHRYRWIERRGVCPNARCQRCDRLSSHRFR